MTTPSPNGAARRNKDMKNKETMKIPFDSCFNVMNTLDLDIAFRVSGLFMKRG